MYDTNWRVRDPVHGVISFRKECDVDSAAWDLISTKEFQRLRRIKQLGFSEFIFPGATHTRLAHCIGVYHQARLLLDKIILLSSAPVDPDVKAITLIAALLHDVGHGPFSHAFEESQKALRRDKFKKHEIWTSDIILSEDSEVNAVLIKHFGVAFPSKVAERLRMETPTDIYHAIVSSSFDADRLDYLQRDRLTTGTYAGTIDLDWLLNNLAVENINPAADDYDPTNQNEAIPALCINKKAFQAAEMFIVARYHLYNQVYFHKTTRGFEQIFTSLLKRVGALISEGKIKDTGLTLKDPVALFIKKTKPALSDYLELDDFAAWRSIRSMCDANDAVVRDLARRLYYRKPFKCIDLDSATDDNQEMQRRFLLVCNSDPFKDRIGSSLMIDRAPLSSYGPAAADTQKAHKRIMVGEEGKIPREITELSATIRSLRNKTLIRIYAESEILAEKIKLAAGANRQ